MGMHIGPHNPSVLLSAKVANITGLTNTITSYTDISGSAWRIYTFLETGTFITDVLSKCDIFCSRSWWFRWRRKFFELWLWWRFWWTSLETCKKCWNRVRIQ